MVESSTEQREAEYLSCAETAKLVRRALREHFPDVRFSVRSNTYSGGASIRVQWTDGPTQAQVQAVCGQYEGGRFDGMMDLAYHAEHWLLPDGSAVLRRTYGHSFDTDEVTPRPSEGARLVNFLADSVFADRDLSPAFRAELEARLLEEWGSRERAAEQHRDPYIWDSLVWRLSQEVAR